MPFKVGDLLKVSIYDLSSQGEGVGRCSGITVFVPGTFPGDQVEAEVISIKPGYGRALATKMLLYSPDRVTPRCSQAEECGGCSWQGLSYHVQLEYKRKQVKDALERIGGFTGIEVLPVLGMNNPWEYRNKAQVPVGNQGGLVAGFYAPRSHNIIPLNPEGCPIQCSANNSAVSTVIGACRRFNILAYNHETQTGLRHILARWARGTGQLMVVLVTGKDNLPSNLIAAVSSLIPDLTGLVQNINTSPGNRILGNKYINLWGQDRIVETIAGLKFYLSPSAFMQVNPWQTEVLYREALDLAGLKGDELVWDLYCGIATISLHLALHARRVAGVEINAAAIANAKENAAVNGIKNTDFYAGPAEKITREILSRGDNPDVVVLDPPRKGCEPDLLPVLIEAAPARIVYVSCNPATLARDLKILAAAGYAPNTIQPVDMFPHTPHVECVVLMSRDER